MMGAVGVHQLEVGGRGWSAEADRGRGLDRGRAWPHKAAAMPRRRGGLARISNACGGSWLSTLAGAVGMSPTGVWGKSQNVRKSKGRGEDVAAGMTCAEMGAARIGGRAWPHKAAAMPRAMMCSAGSRLKPAENRRQQ